MVCLKCVRNKPSSCHLCRVMILDTVLRVRKGVKKVKGEILMKSVPISKFCISLLNYLY